MTKFEEQYIELVAMLGKVPDEVLRDKILQALGAISDSHDEEVAAMRSQGDAALKVLERKLGKALAKAEQAHDKALIAEAQEQDDPVIGDALRTMWDHGDGRKLIERAYKADPKFTRMELDYMGGHLISGELRDQAKLAKEIEEQKKKIN